MRTAAVLDHFKTQQAVAEALGIKQPSVALWGEYPPPKRQLQLQRITAGRLRAEPGILERVLGLDAAGVALNESPARRA